jgi:hypothetical protein
VTTTTRVAETAWSGVEGRRVLREYETKQAMLDDIWEAHEEGWLPVSMTEQRRTEGSWVAFWKRETSVTYTVAYCRQ